MMSHNMAGVHSLESMCHRLFHLSSLSSALLLFTGRSEVKATSMLTSALQWTGNSGVWIEVKVKTTNFSVEIQTGYFPIR